MALHTPQEVAAELRIPLPRAYALIREGVIPAVRIGRTVRVAETVLREFIESGGKDLTDRDDDGQEGAPA